MSGGQATLGEEDEEDEEPIDPFFRDVMDELDRRRKQEGRGSRMSAAAAYGTVASAALAAVFLYRFPDIQGQYKRFSTTLEQAQHMISSASTALNASIGVYSAYTLRRSRQEQQDYRDREAINLELCSFQVLELEGDTLPLEVKLGGLMQRPVSALFADGGKGARKLSDLVLQCADLCDQDRVLVPLPPDNMQPKEYYQGRRSWNVMNSLGFLLLEKLQLPGLVSRASHDDKHYTREVPYLFGLVNFKDAQASQYKLRCYVVRESTVARVKELCPDGTYRELAAILHPSAFMRRSRVRALRALAQMAEVYEPLPLLITKDPQKLENLYLRGEHPLHPGVGRMWLTHTTSKL